MRRLHRRGIDDIQKSLVRVCWLEHDRRGGRGARLQRDCAEARDRLVDRAECVVRIDGRKQWVDQFRCTAGAASVQD